MVKESDNELERLLRKLQDAGFEDLGTRARSGRFPLFLVIEGEYWAKRRGELVEKAKSSNHSLWVGSLDQFAKFLNADAKDARDGEVGREERGLKETSAEIKQREEREEEELAAEFWEELKRLAVARKAGERAQAAEEEAALARWKEKLAKLLARRAKEARARLIKALVERIELLHEQFGKDVEVNRLWAQLREFVGFDDDGALHDLTHRRVMREREQGADQSRGGDMTR